MERAMTTKTTFTTQLLKDDKFNATGIVVPAEAVEALGKSKKPPVVVTIGGFTYRSTVAVMGGLFLIPLSQERRAAAGVEAGQTIEVTLELDTEPRTVEVPEDLGAALRASGKTETFDKVAPSMRKEHVRQVEEAKSQETRERRIARIVEKL
jgi:hypothetical protein